MVAESGCWGKRRSFNNHRIFDGMRVSMLPAAFLVVAFLVGSCNASDQSDAGFDDLFGFLLEKDHGRMKDDRDNFEVDSRSNEMTLGELLDEIQQGEEEDQSSSRSSRLDDLLRQLREEDDNSRSSDSNFMDYIKFFMEFQLDSTRKEEQSNYLKVKDFLDRYQSELSMWRRKEGLLEWQKETNLTKHNSLLVSKEVVKFSTWDDKKRKIAESFSHDGLTDVQIRMLKLMTESSDLKQKELKKRSEELYNKITTIYSKAQVCKQSTGECYHYEPGLIKIMRDSRNYEELLWAWKGWRDAIGPKIRKDWIAKAKLENLGAREHGYKDDGDYIRSLYEDPDFEKEIDDLWKEIKPLYLQLHAYVRNRLHSVYGDRVAAHKPIPAHLLGNMWAMKWDGLLDMVQPNPSVGGFDVTSAMKEKNMTVMQMFHLADEFYQSIGLPPMPPLFWEKSMFTRPKDNRSVVCYASAHNLEKKDVRVKMCAAVNSDYLYVVHHEMGHCQYYLAYNEAQPESFQGGANSGFHEAIGDTAALSVISPRHLQSLGLLKSQTLSNSDVNKKKDLNFLMQKALSKLSFYPFALMMSKWRWDVYRGKISDKNLNAAWWEYRKLYQGVSPPVERTEKDFDPGSKYHITYFVPYIRYFVSHVLQFQFYESMCNLANHTGPLHLCDFAGSHEAGAAFQEMLRMGESKPWPDALEVLTGTRKMSVKPIVRYFKPLTDWLEAENKKLGNKIGWE